MYTAVASGILTMIFALPLLAVLLPWRAVGGSWGADLALGIATPLLYATAYVLTAGLLSRPFQHAVVPGRFPRDLEDPRYRARRLYGLCWTAVYYFTPLYFLCLSLPPLKRMLFRLFGYRGQMRFTVYPDTWIRDLPLLDFGEGAYVSNRATLGTNVARADGTLQVDRISIGARALVGHLSMVAFGTVLEEGAEIGVGCAVGSRCRLAKGSELAPCSVMAHLARLGEGSSVGFMSFLGSGSVVGPGLRLPPVTQLPPRAKAGDPAGAAALLSVALSPLSTLAARLRPFLPNGHVPPEERAPSVAAPADAGATSGVNGSAASGLPAELPDTPIAPPAPATPHWPGMPEPLDGFPHSRWNVFE